MEVLSYRNLSIDLQSKSMDWFLYDRDHRHERVKKSMIKSSPVNTKFSIVSKILEKPSENNQIFYFKT